MGNFCCYSRCRLLRFLSTKDTLLRPASQNVEECSAIVSIASEGPPRDYKSCKRVPILQPGVVDDSFKKYIDFPFLTDEKIGEWILYTRFMFIMRGPPGSGKSYLASCIKNRFPNAQICSADQFWYIDSKGAEYRFDRSQLGEAHKWCQDNAFNAAKLGISPLIIDNTNTREWECHVYFDIARRFDYNVILLTPRTPWRFDVEALTLHNIHGVTAHAIESKFLKFDEVYPMYYGWFWPGALSQVGAQQLDFCNGFQEDGSVPVVMQCEQLIDSSYHDFMTILDVPGLRRSLASDWGYDPDIEVSDFALHWSSAVTPPFGRLRSGLHCTRPHVTAMFCRYGEERGSWSYAQREAVVNALLGILHPITVTGVFMTKRTVGLCVRLPEDLYPLWNSRDNARPRQYQINISTPEVQRPLGARAHVTLALAPGSPAVETGFDVLRIFDANSRGLPDISRTVAERGYIREILIDAPDREKREISLVYEYSTHKHFKLLFAGSY